MAGVVTELATVGLPDVLADRRWRDPEPGSSVIVVISDSTWAHGPTSAEFPLVKVLVYSSSSDGQADAEQIGHPIAAAVRRALHLMDGHVHYWADQRVIGSQHVGSALFEVEGHDWRLRTLTFEVETA